MCDDERRVLRLIQVSLERQGYMVTPCHDAREVFELLDNQEFDVAILDLMMPYHDGFEILKYIRTNERTRDMKVGIMTAMADDVRTLVDLPYEADWYFKKPADPGAWPKL